MVDVSDVLPDHTKNNLINAATLAASIACRGPNPLFSESNGNSIVSSTMQCQFLMLNEPHHRGKSRAAIKVVLRGKTWAYQHYCFVSLYLVRDKIVDKVPSWL